MATAKEWRDKMIAAGYRANVCPKAFNQLAEWAAKSQDRRYRKGLFLLGPCGTGKTMFLTTFLGKCRQFTARRIVAMYNEAGATPDWHQAIHGYHVDTLITTPPRSVILDDVGTEPVAMHFGQKSDVMQDIIADRYEYWQQHEVKTFITTNLPFTEFDERYGRRITDRIGEMCDVIRFDGESAR